MAIFYTDTASFNSLSVTGSTVMSASSNNPTLNLIGSGSNIFSVTGSSGGIFTVNDIVATDTNLFSVSTGSTNIFSIDQSKNINISGSIAVTGSLLLNGSGFITSAQTGSFLTSTQTGSFATTGSNSLTGSQRISGSLVITGSLSGSGNVIVNGYISASSFTGSTNFNTLVNKPTLWSGSAQVIGNISSAGSSFTFQDLVLGSGTTFGTIKTDGTKYIGVYPTNGTESTRFLANGNIMLGTNFAIDGGYRMQISASSALTQSGSLYTFGFVNHTGIITGSIRAANPSSSIMLINGTITTPTGSQSGSSAIYIAPIISASANNQTLAVLDIAPTFSTGSFTGVAALAGRFNGNVLIQGTTIHNSNTTITGSLILTGSMSMSLETGTPGNTATPNGYYKASINGANVFIPFYV